MSPKKLNSSNPIPNSLQTSLSQAFRLSPHHPSSVFRLPSSVYMPYNNHMLQDKVRSAVSQILKSDDFILLTPKSPDFGDYALFMKSETPSPQPPPTPSQSPSIQSQPLGLRSEAGKQIQSQ